MPVHDPRTARAKFDWQADLEADSRERGRKEYTNALITFAVCAGINVLAITLKSGASGVTALGASGVAAGMIFGLQLVLTVVAAFFGVLIVCALLGEDAGPIGLVFLRLAAALAAADLVLFVLPGMGCFTLVLFILALMVAVQVLFDYDRIASLLVALLTVGVSWAIIVFLGVILT